MSNAKKTPPSTLNITASQRAAVVIAVLGEEAAKPIVDMLDDEAIANIAASLETINYLAREQLVEIVMDFLGHLRSSSGALRGGSGVLDRPHHCVGEGLRICFAPEIASPDLLTHDDVTQGHRDPLGDVTALHVTQHQNGGAHQRERIRDALARDVRRAAVDRLEH